MEAKIVNLEKMTVVGYQSLFSLSKENIIPNLWGRFLARQDEMKNIKNPNVALGVCFDIETNKSKNIEHFFYMAALIVNSTDDIPEGMTYKNIPAHKYAKFTHKGKLDKLGETYNYIYQNWLPKSEYKHDGKAIELEWYDNRFKVDSDESEFDIYISIS